jgi:hypothetical protein
VGDTGAGCIAGELEFALNVDPSEPNNDSSHRNFSNTIGLELAFDNSNIAGVSGDGPYETPTAGNPQDVTTGVEFSVPLSALGASAGSGDIKLTIFVNSGGHDFISNQFGGTGILLGNVAGPPFPNLAGDYPGDQFVTVENGAPGSGSGVPEPGSLMLIVAGCAAAFGAARRR